MTRLTSLDLTPFYRSAVGFDQLFDRITSNIDTATTNGSLANYPPYDIVKTGSLTYDIVVALAGYGKNDISVLFEDNILKIESVKSKEEKEVEDNRGVLHQGIAKRNFSKSFTIAEDVEIKNAELKDGLLRVFLEKIVPNHKKARIINIK